MRISIGTTNQFKIRELASILRPLGIQLRVTAPLDPEETEDTFEGNAALKGRVYGKYVGDTLAAALTEQGGVTEVEARMLMQISQEWAVCEDSGITVPALGGLPGPYSARFDDCIVEDGRIIIHRESGRDRIEIDAANNQRLLRMMEEIEQPYRAARFVISLVVADTEGEILFQHTSYADGWIAQELRGEHGFGYDPLFISGDSFGKTWAELDSMRKNLISHRRKALQAFTAWLATQLLSVERMI